MIRSTLASNQQGTVSTSSVRQSSPTGLRFCLKAVHIRTSREREEANYLGTLEDGRGHATLLPITDTITQLGLKSMDILRFKARLKYRPKDSCSIIVYQARDVEVLGSLISRDEEGVEDYE